MERIIRLPQPDADQFIVTDGSGVPITECMTVVFKPVKDDVIAAERNFYTERGYACGAFLLGWRTWVRLCCDVHNDKHHGGGDGCACADPYKFEPLSTFWGRKIVVDELVPDVIRAMPKVGDVRFGGDVTEDLKEFFNRHTFTTGLDGVPVPDVLKAK